MSTDGQVTNPQQPPEDELTPEQAQELIEHFRDKTLLALVKRNGGVLRITFDEIDKAGGGGFTMAMEEHTLLIAEEGIRNGIPTISDETDLLRSAYQIALREGKETNWPAFKRRLETMLVRHAGATASDPNQVNGATCTPKTFRMA